MSMKFTQVAARFLAWARKARHQTTVEVYRHYFRRFAAEVGDLDARKITPAHLTAWAKTWHASQAIVRLYRWAHEDAALLKSNPLARVKHPPKGQRCRIMPRDEQLKILRAARHDLRALLFAYRETWARPGELRAATWDDLQPKTTRAKLREALRNGQGMIVLRDYKCRKRRRLPNAPRIILLSPRVGRLLCRLLAQVEDMTGPIFRTSKGKRWTANALRCRMRRLRSLIGSGPDARGENVVPYTFRHTGATVATALGIRDRMLADALGHTETATTARYQHLQVEHIREALRACWHRHASESRSPFNGK